MADLSAMICREQAFLETFFLSLSQFSFDKAKEMAEKEREFVKHQVGSVFHSMLACLSQLAVAEKAYMSLSFLASKGFLRKDNSMKPSYDVLRTEFGKTEELGRTSCGDEQGLEKLLAHLCGQLTHFVSVRLDLIEFYEKMYNIGTSRCGGSEELHVNILSIMLANQNQFHHPNLSHLKTSFSYECESLTKLMSAQLELQQWTFLPSLLHLHEAHSKLSAWGALAQMKESRRLPFSPGFLKNTQLPLLYLWLVRFKGYLISKFTLYFHEILGKQTTVQDMKSLCSKAPIDFYQKLVTFQRKSDASFIMLMFDARGCEGYKGHGYHHPDRAMETPKGLGTYPAVVSIPPDAPTIHWPNIVMILEDRAHDLNSLERVVCFYDKHVQCTYLLVRIDVRMTLAMLFQGKRSDKESNVAGFLEEFCTQFRFHRVLATLRPGNK